MVEISIICLIYKSKQLAQALYESVQKYTPKLATGQAEFFFIANDPTKEVKDFLESKNIPHIVNINEHLNDEKLFSMGFSTPEYMRRVYQGYNQGILHAQGQKIVLINSDNFFSEDWLENLLKYSDYKKVVSSTLVEPGQQNFGVFPFAIEKDFGRTLDDFMEEEFQDFVEKNSKTGYSSGGAYMPCLLYKDIAIMAGLYPEGNIAGKSFDEVKYYGDEFFYDRLKSFGVEHITAKDSLVYHLKEGEKSEIVNKKPYKSKVNRSLKLNDRLVVHQTDLLKYIIPVSNHQEILDELSKKVSFLILHPRDVTDLLNQLKIADGFGYKNSEVTVMSDIKVLRTGLKPKINFIYTTRAKTDFALRKLFFEMYGEYLLLINQDIIYPNALLSKLGTRDAIYYFGGQLELIPFVEYMGNFIFTKKLLTENAPLFLGHIIRPDRIAASELKTFQIIDLSEIPEPLPEAPPTPLLVKAVAKIRQDGPLEFTKSAYRRIYKK